MRGVVCGVWCVVWGGCPFSSVEIPFQGWGVGREGRDGKGRDGAKGKERRRKERRKLTENDVVTCGYGC